MLVPRAKTQLDRQKAFNQAAPSAWNDVWKDPKLSEIIQGNSWQFKKKKNREDSCFAYCKCLIVFYFGLCIAFELNVDIECSVCELYLIVCIVVTLCCSLGQVTLEKRLLS